ncbi:PBS lyase HEAT-like repeat protein [Calothrix parasitica NIES-267]|uniref:PBS lyase HEAT-like repeat protein n=1 Tax=Calothrix parasitica NIES-267 TaxID=1973488 RepID=A0A1Z4LPQ9_9CYAN|nr:PBS lyase HEAT-like repeat protein [Calothrix parasitica NIES-267]
MSLVIQTLEKIEKWLKLNQPSVASFPYPGLTNKQIEELTKNLSFKLPKEVQELYQWHNGTRHGHGFFPFHVFYSLEECLGFNSNIIDYWDDAQSMSLHTLILFSIDKSFFFTVSSCEEQELSPIWVMHMGDEPVVCFESLTNLLLMISDCYETGAYYVDNKGYLEEDTAKSNLIFSRYNPDIKNRPDLGIY